MIYVTPQDMQEIYDEQVLVQVTNFSDRSVEEINLPLLDNACASASRLIEGYLLSWGIPPGDFSMSFQEILKTHAARLTMDFLAGSDPQIREQAKESMDWLKSLGKLSRDALNNLVLAPADPPLVAPDNLVLPSVGFEPGRSWEVTF